MDADVIVVGAGPVGLVLAILLGRQGVSVLVVERRDALYPLPRAVHFDGETARVLARCGIGPALAEIGEPVNDYDWVAADGAVLLHFDWARHGPTGWPNATMFCQPALEGALRQRLSRVPGVRTVTGAVTEVHQDAASARVVLADSTTLAADFVIGCDGANSLVASALGSTVTDLGFSYDWLIVDTVPPAERQWRPVNLQICDPARPVTAVSGGPGRRRFEFMRLPGETLAELDDDAVAWRLLEPFDLHPGNTRLERRAPYTFHARWLDCWRSGRVAVAGDAAHLMPPFAGQGMCAGIRDAANLAWKLGLVLRGGPADLLDTYTSERVPHLRRAMEMSVTLGQIICVTDPGAAAERDANLALAGGDGNALEAALPPAVLGPGAHRGDLPAGLLAPQGRVAIGEVQGLLDDVLFPGTAPGFVLLTDGVVPDDVPGLTGLTGVTVAPLGAGVSDLDGGLLEFLRTHGLVALAVRPDGYVFGGARTPADLPTLLDALRPLAG